MPWNYLTLNDGTYIPRIAYGTGSLGSGTSTVDYVDQALSVGFSHIDTAQMYRNEAETGKAIRESGLARSDIYITTKYSGVDGKSIAQSIRESLEKLGVSYVDLYLIHSPRYATPDIQTAWAQMEEVKKEGLAKSIGISNFNVEEITLLLASAKVVPAVNQIQFHPGVFLSEQFATYAFCEKKGILIEGYSPLIPLRRSPKGSVAKTVRKIAERLGTEPEEVLLAWSKAKGVVVVTSSRQKPRLEGYLDAGDIELTDSEVSEIDRAGLVDEKLVKAFLIKRVAYFTTYCIVVMLVLAMAVIRIL